MTASGQVRRVVLALAALVLIGAIVGLVVPDLRAGSPRTVGLRARSAVPTTAGVPTTAFAAPTTGPAAPTTATAAPVTAAVAATIAVAATTAAPTIATPGTGVASGGALASTGLSPWWWLGGGGLAYLGIIVLWGELQLRPEPELARWSGRYRPRHRRRA